MGNSVSGEREGEKPKEEASGGEREPNKQQPVHSETPGFATKSIVYFNSLERP